jgi:hypothetical protein
MQRDHWLTADDCPSSGRTTSDGRCTAWTCARGFEVHFCAVPSGGHVPPEFTVPVASAFLREWVGL